MKRRRINLKQRWSRKGWQLPRRTIRFAAHP
jgi:hypothetical protein